MEKDAEWGLFLLFWQMLTSEIALRRPDQPLEYMVEELEKLQEQDRQRKGVISRMSGFSKSASSQRGQPSAEGITEQIGMVD